MINFKDGVGGNPSDPGSTILSSYLRATMQTVANTNCPAHSKKLTLLFEMGVRSRIFCKLQMLPINHSINTWGFLYFILQNEASYFLACYPRTRWLLTRSLLTLSVAVKREDASVTPFATG